MKRRLEDRLLNLLLEFCLDIFHEDEVSEYLFFVSECSISMIGYIIEYCMSCEYIVDSHDDQAYDNRYADDTPISMELVESEVAIDVLELVGVHDGDGLFDELCEDNISF